MSQWIAILVQFSFAKYVQEGQIDPEPDSISPYVKKE